MHKGIILLFFFLAQISFGQILPIVPKPQKVQFCKGKFDLSKNIQFLHPKELDYPSGIQQLLADLNVLEKTEIQGSPLNILWLGLVSKSKKAQQYCHDNQLLINDIGEEGYYLHLRPDSIIILANTNAGLLYGLQSLKQLILYYQAEGAIPCLQITDFPAFKYRAVMDDISRGPLSNMTFLKTQIRRLSELKINVFTFYIEHVIKTKNHPKFSPEDGITIEEFKELSAYAKGWNIELIGSFQSLGHFRNVLNAPEYRHLGLTDRMLKPADAKSLTFLKAVYSEMLPAFSSDFFNINADEAWDLTQVDLEEDLTTGQLYANHVNPLLKFLLEKGKKPMLWGDMLLAYPNAFNYLPKETTILTWEYSGYDDFSKWIDPIKAKGFDFWVCPGIVNSNRMIPEYAETFINLQNFIKEGYDKGAIGVLTTVWDDGGGHFFSRDWYGVAYAAAQSWQPNQETFEAYEQQFSATFYQDKQQLLPKALNTLNTLKELGSTQKLGLAFLKEQLLPDFGSRHRLNAKDLSEIRTIAEKANLLLQQLAKQKNSENHWRNDLDYWLFFTTHLLTITNTYTSILEVAKGYDYARQLQSEKVPNYAIHLVNNKHKIQQLVNNWKALKTDYLKLWFKENRLYSLEEASAIFDDKIEALIQLETLMTFLENLPSNLPLPDPTAVKLAIEPTYNKYFTFWLLSAPFPITESNKFSSDFLPELKGELNARPTPYDWQKYQSPLADKIDFKKVFNLAQPSVIYAYCRIESIDNQNVIANIDYGNTLEIILNGEKIKLLSDATKISLALKKGKNHLILKMLASPQSTTFSFYFPKEEVRNRKQKYQLIK